jgi:hypothetical protein
LPEVEHADFVQQFGQHRADADDLLEVVAIAERRMRQEICFIAFALRRFDGFGALGGWLRGRRRRRGAAP